MWSVGHARKLRVNLQAVQWTKTTTLTRSSLDELLRGHAKPSLQTAHAVTPSPHAATASAAAITSSTSSSTHVSTLSRFDVGRTTSRALYPPPPPPPQFSSHSHAHRCSTQPQQTDDDSHSHSHSESTNDRTKSARRSTSSSGGARTRRFQANTVDEYEAVIRRARTPTEVDLLFRESNARFGEHFATLCAAAQQQSRLGAIALGVRYLEGASPSTQDEHFSMSFLHGCMSAASQARDEQSVRDVHDLMKSVQSRRTAKADDTGKSRQQSKSAEEELASSDARKEKKSESPYLADTFKRYKYLIMQAGTSTEVDILFREMNTRYDWNITSLRAAFSRLASLKHEKALRLGVQYLKEASERKSMRKSFTRSFLVDVLPVAVRRRDAESVRDIIDAFPEELIGMQELSGAIRVHRSDPKRGCEYVERLLGTGELDSIAAHVAINVCNLADNYELGERVWQQTVEFDKRGDSVLNRAVYRARIKFVKDMSQRHPELQLDGLIKKTYQHAARRGYNNIYEEDESFVHFKSELAPHIGRQKFWRKTSARKFQASKPSPKISRPAPPRASGVKVSPGPGVPSSNMSSRKFSGHNSTSAILERTRTSEGRMFSGRDDALHSVGNAQPATVHSDDTSAKNASDVTDGHEPSESTDNVKQDSGESLAPRIHEHKEGMDRIASVTNVGVSNDSSTADAVRIDKNVEESELMSSDVGVERGIEDTVDHSVEEPRTSERTHAAVSIDMQPQFASASSSSRP